MTIAQTNSRKRELIEFEIKQIQSIITYNIYYTVYIYYKI